jgi:multisubunit Na+/H+ antiporter MnhE subunit
MNSRLRSALQTLVCAVTLFVFWVACVSTLRVHELLVGGVAVLLSAVASIAVIRTLPLHFKPSLANLMEAWRIPGYVAVDTWVVTLALARDLMGRRAPSLFRSAPWRWNKNSGPDTAARTLAVAYTTASPNMVVVGIDCERGQILFHQLHKSAVPAMTRRLGAED